MVVVVSPSVFLQSISLDINLLAPDKATKVECCRLETFTNRQQKQASLTGESDWRSLGYLDAYCFDL